MKEEARQKAKATKRPPQKVPFGILGFRVWVLGGLGFWWFRFFRVGGLEYRALGGGGGEKFRVEGFRVWRLRGSQIPLN